MADLDRRDFLKLAGAATAGLTAGALGIPVADRLLGGAPLTAQAWADKIDYRQAKAIPTICFGCTTPLRGDRLGPGRPGAAHRGQSPRAQRPRPDLRQGQRHDPGHLLPRTTAPPAETGGPARVGAVEAHLVGRGPRRDRLADEEDPTGGPSRAFHLPLRPRQDQGLFQPLHQRFRHPQPAQPALDLQLQPAGAADELLRP